jgi:alpha-L-fucosidase 2
LPLTAILHCAAEPTTADGPFPAVIVVHGGGFTGGDRRHSVAPLREALSDGDFVWFSIDYRLAPAYKPSDASDDIDAAVGFVRQNARKFKVDPSRIALLGESAGG